MAETFNWIIKNQVRISYKPEVKSIKFAGYEQRTSTGLNNSLPAYRVTIMPKADEVETVLDFFHRHRGADWFNWSPARQGVGRFVCERWDVDDKTQNVNITATFRQVLA